jgi:hypothetical protein
MVGIGTVRAGVLCALLAIGFGFGMGALFGANEEAMKEGLKTSGEAVLAERYGGDEAKLKAVLDKAWVYYQRAHLHAGGLGAVALGLCLLLAALPGAAGRGRALAALCSGLGAVLYPVYWLLAGMKAPGLGSTGAAKEALQWLAIPGSGLAIVGLLLTLVLSARALFGPSAPGP